MTTPGFINQIVPFAVATATYAHFARDCPAIKGGPDEARGLLLYQLAASIIGPHIWERDR